ncbi:hypothetical protein A5653_17625 [Mycobacterium colombiense]|uniref:Wadjet anti-phage system protein JetD domain-containing protein n=1 Tax=Mycobacterium colombiense TaxID=339268 RepID=UPI0007FCB90A|nr:Wadjet anti-phage system protein JetD domain-containing protein [Mycobacterium colombiense]OBK67150.1 hypothetical protein A5653_17625 [Mycobacterium colombiense]
MTPRSRELNALADALGAAARVRILSPQLWQMWTAAAPRLHGDPRQASELAAALDILSERGTIELPVDAWDRSTTPPLPRSITVPAARKAHPMRPWTTFPWCPQLGWVSSLSTLTPTLFDAMIAINAWLAATNGGQAPVVPMRYRSAELFGDEKRLENMMRSNLFGDGRISLAMLACTRIPPPLAAARVGEGADVLVTENSDPYWAAVDSLKAATGHTVGLVVWGAGKSFPSQVPALAVDIAGHGPTRGVVWYWGDMDPDGLAIATEASRLSSLNGGPRILPAKRLWSAMADVPVQSKGNVDWSREKAGQAWLGDDLALRLNDIRAARGRVAQEVVAVDVIEKWATSLSDDLESDSTDPAR